MANNVVDDVLDVPLDFLRIGLARKCRIQYFIDAPYREIRGAQESAQQGRQQEKKRDKAEYTVERNPRCVEEHLLVTKPDVNALEVIPYCPYE